MPGSITLPQIVLDLEEEDRKAYEALKPPTSMVVRYGYMRLVGEFPYEAPPGSGSPGCGSKLVVRTPRGIELGEMLTSTCPNAGCSKSVSRKEMLEYIERSGGKDYPFTTNGKVLRIATLEDLNEQSRLDADKPAIIKFTKARIEELRLPMKLVEVELLLGGERVIFHYASEQWVDFRELVRILAQEFRTRIEMHQVNARDEARIVADYEKCGQHCCCRQFLKVLKPVSMRSAKVQKATLDPTKISGRCGRLMCCLRYEDETYETLRKKLPKRNTVVETEDGVGVVIDTQILTQLALVRFDKPGAPAAYPIENLRMLGRDEVKQFEVQRAERQAEAARVAADRQARMDRRRGGPPQGGAGPGPAPGPGGAGPGSPPPSGSRGYGNRHKPSPPASEPRRPQPGRPLEPDEIEAVEGEPIDFEALPPAGSEGPQDADQPPTAEGAGLESGEQRRRRRRRRRRRGGGGGGGGGAEGGSAPPQSPS